jgi:hypothetical protein
MQDCWKPVEVIIPETLSAREVLDYIYTLIRINATAAGDFVQQIRVGGRQPHSDGWCKWSVLYLPGPAAPFPTLVDHPTDADAVRGSILREAHHHNSGPHRSDRWTKTSNQRDDEQRHPR